MVQSCSCIATLLFAAACIVAVTHGAEDGSEAWLRYKLAPSAVLSGYREQFAARLVHVNASKSIWGEPAGLAQLHTAADELSDGLTQILGDKVSQECCGTPDDTSAAVQATGTLHVQVTGEADSSLGDEGFEISRTATGDVQIRAGTASAALYGSFHLLSFMQRAEPIPAELKSVPALKLRIWDMWDNIDGSIERGFGGRSLIWPMALDPADWTQAVALRVEGMSRLLKSVGVNGVVLNNVNACGRNTALLQPDSIASIGQTIEPIFQKWGLRLYLSPCYAAPLSSGMGLPVLNGVDPLDPKVESWWKHKVEDLIKHVPSFGGFLVKADSEGNKGPIGYNRTEADGANLLARALPDGGVVMWRAFVYGNGKVGQEDRARQAADTFLSLDGKFDSNVVVQVKNGPMDFQVREPVSPLLTGLLKNTNVMMEIQAAQEYTGQAVHAVGLTRQWAHYLGTDSLRLGKNSTLSNLLSKRGPFSAVNASFTGMAAVSNFGDNVNWTGSILGQSNTFGFGRLAWEPSESSAALHTDWAARTFGGAGVPAAGTVINSIVDIMERSWEVYENYTSPLGIGFVVSGGYGGGPCMGQAAFNANSPTLHTGGCPAAPCHNTRDRTCPQRWPDYLKLHDSHYWMDPCNWGYSNYTEHGLGCDRTSQGSGYASQYPAAMTKILDDVATCPQELLLFFHNVPWSFKLKSGLTVMEHIEDASSAAVAEVSRMKDIWDNLKGIDAQVQKTVSERFDLQSADAQFFRNVLVNYYHEVSKQH